MATGFRPKYERTIELAGYSSEELMLLAIEASKSLGWQAGSIKRDKSDFYTPTSFRSWQEKVILSVTDGRTDNFLLQAYAHPCSSWTGERTSRTLISLQLPCSSCKMFIISFRRKPILQIKPRVHILRKKRILSFLISVTSMEVLKASQKHCFTVRSGNPHC